MAKIQIYSTGLCPYCVAAKNFLCGRGLAYEELRVDRDPLARAAMAARASGLRSVPQIFIDDLHVGGYEELVALARNGGLEPLLEPKT